MANPYLILWFDPTLNKLYTGWNQNTPASTPILKQGDDIGVELHWVKGGSANIGMQEIVFPPAADITLAVGRVDAEPTSGVFKLTYGGDETAALDWDTTAAELQTALNGLASITSEGGVAVNKVGSVFRVVWNTASVTANTLSADVNNLSPTSDSQVVVARAGSATDRQAILFSLKQAPIAACTSFTPTPDPAITVTSIFANTWRVSISPSPKTGSFVLTQLVGATSTSTDPIPYNASALTVQEELNAVLDGYFVIRSGEFSWDITAPSSVVNITATSALVGYSSMYGILSMNTAEVEEFLAGSENGTATMEVQADISSEIQTLIQTEVTVINDLISTSTFTLVDMGSVMPVDSVVRFDTPQTLTAGEQLTARTNIGAAAETDIAALEAEDIALDGRLDAVEGYLDQAVKTDSDVTFNSVTLSNATSGNALEYNPAGDGYKVFIDSYGSLTGKWVDGGVDFVTWGLNGEEGFFFVSSSWGISLNQNGLIVSGSGTSIQYPDGTQQVTAFIPADYLTASSIASTYLSQASASSTYLTQANAATTYGSLANTPTTDQKAALAAQSYSSTPPSSTNKYLTKSDFDANFITETHTIATNTGINHSANDVIATGIIPNPDDTKSWLVTVAFNYATSSADLLSDVWWQSNNHELYFEEEGSLVGAQMTFARNSWQFILPAGVTGYEFWSSANAAFVGLSGELVICYKSV